MSKDIGETGIRYLNINHRVKWNCQYHVSVTIKGKQFTVWRGNDIDLGTKIAKKVQSLMMQGKSKFLDWFDNDKDKWLENLKLSAEKSIIEIGLNDDSGTCNCCFSQDKDVKVHAIRLGRDNHSISIRICDVCLERFAEKIWEYLGGETDANQNENQ